MMKKDIFSSIVDWVRLHCSPRPVRGIPLGQLPLDRVGKTAVVSISIINNMHGEVEFLYTPYCSSHTFSFCFTNDDDTSPIYELRNIIRSLKRSKKIAAMNFKRAQDIPEKIATITVISRTNTLKSLEFNGSGVLALRLIDNDYTTTTNLTGVHKENLLWANSVAKKFIVDNSVSDKKINGLVLIEEISRWYHSEDESTPSPMKRLLVVENPSGYPEMIDLIGKAGENSITAVLGSQLELEAARIRTDPNTIRFFAYQSKTKDYFQSPGMLFAIHIRVEDFFKRVNIERTSNDSSLVEIFIDDDRIIPLLLNAADLEGELIRVFKEKNLFDEYAAWYFEKFQ